MKYLKKKNKKQKNLKFKDEIFIIFNFQFFKFNGIFYFSNSNFSILKI
jgi:hypothetical protein